MGRGLRFLILRCSSSIRYRCLRISSLTKVLPTVICFLRPERRLKLLSIARQVPASRIRALRRMISRRTQGGLGRRETQAALADRAFYSGAGGARRTE